MLFVWLNPIWVNCLNEAAVAEEEEEEEEERGEFRAVVPVGSEGGGGAGEGFLDFLWDLRLKERGRLRFIVLVAAS